MPMALHPEEWTSRFLRRLAELLPDAQAVSAVWALKAYATLPRLAPEAAAEAYLRDLRSSDLS